MPVISNKNLLGVSSLGLVLASGIMLNILACALFDNNWWSFFVVLAYVAAPIPDFAVKHIRCFCGGYCGETDDFSDDDNTPTQGLLDAAYFLTGFLVASGLLLPLVLGHTKVIGTVPMLMSFIGGILVYVAIASYIHVYHSSMTGEEEDDGADMEL